MSIDSNLENVYDNIMQALSAEDVFGYDDMEFPSHVLRKKIERKYESLKKVVNPRVYQDVQDAEWARDAQNKLQQFLQEAQKKIEEGVYGFLSPLKKEKNRYKPFHVAGREYYLGEKSRDDEYFDYYEGLLKIDQTYGDVLIKIVKNNFHNAMVQNEMRIMNILYKKSVPQKKHLPVIMNSFESNNRRGIIFRKSSGVILKDIRKDVIYRNGIDQRHMIWMLDRLLSLLGYAHKRGIVHGTLGPQNIVIRPQNHNAIVMNWAHALYRPAKTGQILDVAMSMFSAPEQENGRVGPWSDMYSLGKIMIWILGGNPETNDMPHSVAEEVQEFLLRMVQEDIHTRPQDAWKLHSQQVALKDRLWKRKFLHFEMSS